MSHAGEVNLRPSDLAVLSMDTAPRLAVEDQVAEDAIADAWMDAVAVDVVVREPEERDSTAGAPTTITCNADARVSWDEVDERVGPSSIQNMAEASGGESASCRRIVPWTRRS